MVKKASLKNELFIVLLLEEEVLEKCQAIQKEIAEHYNIYPEGNYPELHITLDRIKKEDLSKARDILQQVASKFSAVKIELDSFSCYRQMDSKFLVLKIKQNESLIAFANQLHLELEKEGLSTIENYDNWEYHITILSNIFAENPINNLDFESLCAFMEGDNYIAQSYSDKVEIWSPVNIPEDKCLYSLKLSDY
ncbi:MAG: 2'-5' RNA ligase family protein [Halanaerobiales bacterium]